MSIQPVRVIGRIIEQVDRSDWPVLEGRFFRSVDGVQSLRFFRAPMQSCYATPLHFWVHALRDERAAVGRRVDLVGAAGHAMCRRQPIAQWREELEEISVDAERPTSAVLELEPGFGRNDQSIAYRMLDSACRRSSVVCDGEWLVAHFWSHGFPESWRCEVQR